MGGLTAVADGLDVVRAAVAGPKPFRVLVTGDRNWRCHDLARRVCARLKAKYGNVVVIQGAADGVDYAFADAAFDLEMGVASFPAEWDRHGKGAGPKRNAEMVASGADLCIAVHRFIRGSKGTRDCARQAIEAGIPTFLVKDNTGDPRRLTLGDLD